MPDMSRLVVSLKSQHDSSKPVIAAASLPRLTLSLLLLREYFLLQTFIPLWISLLLPLFWFCLERQTLSGSQQPEVCFFCAGFRQESCWMGQGSGRCCTEWIPHPKLSGSLSAIGDRHAEFFVLRGILESKKIFDMWENTLPLALNCAFPNYPKGMRTL